MLVYGLLFLYLTLLAVVLVGFRNEILKLKAESIRRNSHLLAVEESLIVVIKEFQKLNKERKGNVQKLPVSKRSR